MTLSAGSRFGWYEVVSSIGAGGMGEIAEWDFALAAWPRPCGACLAGHGTMSLDVVTAGRTPMTDEVELVDETRLRAVFRALAERQVAYAVFGGVALGLHGLARATADLDLFVAPDPENIARLKSALRAVFEDPSIDEISAEDLCGDYPAVRYIPPEGFGFDILTRLGEAFRYADLKIEVKTFGGVEVRVVTARTLWELKKGTLRPVDRIDARALADRFGFGD